LQAIYVDKHISRALLTKAIAPSSAARAVHLDNIPLPGSCWVRVKNDCRICSLNLELLIVIRLRISNRHLYWQIMKMGGAGNQDCDAK